MLSDQVPLPTALIAVAMDLEWLNVEYIGGQAIEAHARYNDDFRNHHSDEIYPQWCDEPSLDIPDTA